MRTSDSTFLLAMLTLIAGLIGVALRIRFTAEPLWIDELHSAWAINTHFGDIAFRAGQGNQTPVYFWISWLFCQLFGYAEWELRLPSVVFSSVTIVLAALFVWRCTGDAVVSGTTAILVSIDSWFIFYGSEARPYALLQMLSVLQVGCLAREWNRDDFRSSKWIAKPVSWPLILLTSFLIATHLTAMILVAAQFLYVLAFGKPWSNRRIILSLVVSSFVVFPLLPTLVSAYEKRADWNPVSDSAQLLQDAGTPLLIYVLLPVTCLLAYRVFKNKLFTKRALRNPTMPSRGVDPNVTTRDISTNQNSTIPSSDANRENVSGSIVGLTLVWGLGPLLIVWLLELSGTIPLAAYRYTVAGSLALPIFSGLAIAAIGSVKMRLSVCFVLLLLAAGINPVTRSCFFPEHSARYRSEDWKSAIEQLGQTSQSGNQPVFLFANLIEDHRSSDVALEASLSNYLKFPLTAIYNLPGKPEIIPMPTCESMRWNANHLQLIQRFDGARIIARVTLSEMQAIVAELQTVASKHSLEIGCEISFQPDNVIKIANISCRN